MRQYFSICVNISDSPCYSHTTLSCYIIFVGYKNYFYLSSQVIFHGIYPVVLLYLSCWGPSEKVVELYLGTSIPLFLIFQFKNFLILPVGFCPLESSQPLGWADKASVETQRTVVTRFRKPNSIFRWYPQIELFSFSLLFLTKLLPSFGGSDENHLCFHDFQLFT